MAIVVESVSPVATAISSNLTVTKPTGVAVGDLLVAVLFAVEADVGSLAGESWTLLSGWSNAGSVLNGVTNAVSFQYKLATSGDVSASNFTFNFSDNETLRGYIVRASGNMTEADPLRSSSVAFTPETDGFLVFTHFVGVDSPVGPSTISDYTAAGVSFTEGDDSYHGDGTPGLVQGSAYGIQATATAVSSFTATFSSTFDTQYKQIAFFAPPINAAGTNTLTTATSASFTQAGTADTIIGNVLTETDTTVFAQNGKGTAPTQWTNETKPSTTWVNETK